MENLSIGLATNEPDMSLQEAYDVFELLGNALAIEEEKSRCNDYEKFFNVMLEWNEHCLSLREIEAVQVIWKG